MTAYGFSENDAKRIGKVVRLVEKSPDRISLGELGAEGAAPGVRLLIGRPDVSEWPTGSTAVVTIYNGDVPGSVATAATVVAYNHFVHITTNEPCTSKWVALGHNGFAWHVVEHARDCAQTCYITVDNTDFARVPGYQQTSVQMLGHDGGGCIRWYDITTCATA